MGRRTRESFGTQDFLVLDLVHREEPIPPELHARLNRLVELGVVERTGRGRGARYLLARRFYALVKKKGHYTRKRGLDRETNKQLLLRHIQDNASEGSRMADLKQVLPGHSRGQIQVLLREFKRDGLVVIKGRTRAALWYPAVSTEDCDGSSDQAQ
jgi:ATP-dependent DNA helicase RecG